MKRLSLALLALLFLSANARARMRVHVITVAEARKRADVIFSGRVIWVKKSKEGGVEVRVAVENNWKGSPAKRQQA